MAISEHPPLKCGMDNPYYQFEPLPQRQQISWPSGKRIALVVLLHLEYWQLDAPADAERDRRFVGEYGSFSPDYRTWSQREYGNRVGLSRLLAVLDRYKLKLTVPANAACAGRHDTLIQQLRERQAEFVGHGSYANSLISSKLSEAEERLFIKRSLDTLEQATGTRPVGWAGQDYGESARTPQLLAEAGLDYVLDWPNDDAPYRMRTKPGLISIPRQPEWDDVEQLWLRRIATPRYPDIAAEAFETLHQEGGRVFVLSLHPWLMGMAHRIRYLDEALARITSHDGVWSATAQEVARQAQLVLAPDQEIRE